jgi:hypothetical protein
MGWHDSEWRSLTGDYVAHVLMELGRLGLTIDEVEDRGRPPNTMVLSDLLAWLSDPPGKAFAQLGDWQRLDLDEIRRRLRDDRAAKPRIEVSATITKMRNLSVRWHPAGWGDAEFDWTATNADYFNLISRRKWPKKPDFRWFEGDQTPTFETRSSNELMYVRGVGNLRPDPREEYFGSYNRDVLDSILICAVRAAYESLVRQLGFAFDVEILDAFDFETREEIDESRGFSSKSPINRVVKWTLEDAEVVQARRERKAAEDQGRRDREEFERFPQTYGLSVDIVVAALVRASAKSASGSTPSEDVTFRVAAKDLRAAGFKIDAGHVRRFRNLVERFRPETLVSARQRSESAAPPRPESAPEKRE